MPGSRQEEAKAQAVRVAIGDAIRKAYKGSPYPRQEDLAAVLGVDQSTVSKWCRGETSINVETIERIESACGRLHGTIYWDAGLVDPRIVFTINYDKLVEEAIAERPNVRRAAPSERKATADRAARLLQAATAGNPKKNVGARQRRPAAGDTPIEPGTS